MAIEIFLMGVVNIDKWGNSLDLRRPNQWFSLISVLKSSGKLSFSLGSMGNFTKWTAKWRGISARNFSAIPARMGSSFCAILQNMLFRWSPASRIRGIFGRSPGAVLGIVCRHKQPKFSLFLNSKDDHNFAHREKFSQRVNATLWIAQ